MTNQMLQAMMDGMSAQWQKERSETQMTLGKLIERLESLPSGSLIDGLGRPHSYRGYYSDLAFERPSPKITVENALVILRACMGETFTGYKGGEFQMGKNTPVWLANYGDTGPRLMAVNDDGSFDLRRED